MIKSERGDKINLLVVLSTYLMYVDVELKDHIQVIY